MRHFLSIESVTVKREYVLCISNTHIFILAMTESVLICISFQESVVLITVVVKELIATCRFDKNTPTSYKPYNTTYNVCTLLRSTKIEFNIMFHLILTRNDVIVSVKTINNMQLQKIYSFCQSSVRYQLLCTFSKLIPLGHYLFFQ